MKRMQKVVLVNNDWTVDSVGNRRESCELATFRNARTCAEWMLDLTDLHEVFPSPGMPDNGTLFRITWFEIFTCADNSNFVRDNK